MALHAKGQVCRCVYMSAWAYLCEESYAAARRVCRQQPPTHASTHVSTHTHTINPNKQQLAELGVLPDYRFYAEAIDALWRMRPLATLVRSYLFSRCL